MRPMDAQTEKHLLTWINRSIHWEEARRAEAAIRAVISDYPDLIEKGYSWPEILALAPSY